MSIIFSVVSGHIVVPQVPLHNYTQILFYFLVVPLFFSTSKSSHLESYLGLQIVWLNSAAGPVVVDDDSFIGLTIC